jgi:hypothetical protein
MLDFTMNVLPLLEPKFVGNVSKKLVLLFRITVEAQKVDKRMVLEYTHGLFIT